jgi:hypothetical protein
MPDRERELERELRELGSLIDYPPTPDTARAARNLIDEEEDDRPSRFPLALPTLRWAAVAAAFVLVVAVPALSPTLRATVSDWFPAGDAQMSGAPAVDGSSVESESKANVSASGASKNGEAVTSPALTPQFSGERISLPEAQARMAGVLILPRTPKLGKPDEIYTFPKDGVVLVYGLPPVGDTGINLILSEVPGDVEPAYLAGETAVRSKLDRVMVDGHPGYWGPAKRLPSEMDRRLLGNVLLWEQRGVALRLEANLSKEQAVRIAESVR